MTDTAITSTIEVNIFILEELPEGRNIEAIKLDVSVRNQWLG